MKDKIISLLNEENIVELSHEFSSIKKLDLSNSNINDKQIYVLTSALKSNKSIQSVKLNNNNITKDGLEALAVLMELNHTIISLHLFNNKFKSVELRNKIDEALRRNNLERTAAEAFKRKLEEEEKVELQSELANLESEAEREKDKLEKELEESQRSLTDYKTQSEEKLKTLRIEFENKRDQLEFEKQNLGNQFEQLKNTSADEKINLEKKLEELNGQSLQLEQSLKLEITELRDKLSDELGYYNSEIERLKKEYHFLQKLTEDAQQESQIKISFLTQKVKDYEENSLKTFEIHSFYKQSMEMQIKTLESSKVDLEKKLYDANVLLSNTVKLAEEDTESLTKKLSLIENEFSILTTKHKASEQEIESYNEKIAEIETEHNIAIETNKILQMRLAEVSQSNIKLTEENKKLESNFATNYNEHQTLAKLNAELTLQLTEAIERYNTVDSENKDLQSKLVDLNNREKNNASHTSLSDSVPLEEMREHEYVYDKPLIGCEIL